MKKITKAYRCYMEDGSNKIYLNKHAGRANSNETTIVLADGMKIVKNFYDCRCIEYNGVIYTDSELKTKGNRVHINLYQSGDSEGRPTGKMIQAAEEVEE